LTQELNPNAPREGGAQMIRPNQFPKKKKPSKGLPTKNSPKSWGKKKENLRKHFDGPATPETETTNGTGHKGDNEGGLNAMRRKPLRKSKGDFSWRFWLIPKTGIYGGQTLEGKGERTSFIFGNLLLTSEEKQPTDCSGNLPAENFRKRISNSMTRT